MFCGNCGMIVRDGASFCPKCGTKITVQTQPGEPVPEINRKQVRNPQISPRPNPRSEQGADAVWGSAAVPIGNAYQTAGAVQYISPMQRRNRRTLAADRAALRYFFTPVAISMIGMLVNLIHQRVISYYGIMALSGASSYNSALSLTELVLNVFRCAFAFLICRSGREQKGARILLILSIVFSVIPALAAPWMLPLYNNSPEISAAMPQMYVMAGLLIAGGTGILLGSLLKPGRVWIYAVTAAGILVLSVFGAVFFRPLSHRSEALFYCVSSSLVFFAFYAFPSVGLSAAWAKDPAPVSLVRLSASGQTSSQELGNFSELSPELQREAPSPGFAVLGFFIPPAGLILWLLWNRSFPGKSRSAGQGAAMGAVVFWMISCGILSAFLQV